MNQYRFRTQSNFPPVVKNLIIINVLVFIAQLTLQESSFNINNMFALHDVHSVFFQPHQLLTYMFMHGSIDHILFNMLALWMFGSQLENDLGPKKFLFYYLACGIGAGLLHLLVLYFQMQPVMEQFKQLPMDMQLEIVNSARFKINVATLGASGSVFGLLLGFGYLHPNASIQQLFLPISIKAKWFVLIYGAVELMLGIRNSAGDNVAHFAHLGGAITGFIILLIWNKTNRRTLY